MSSEWDALVGIFGAVLGFFIVMFLIVIVIAMVILVLRIVGIWKTLDKMGRPGWAALIPVYSSWELAKGACLDEWKAIALTISDAARILLGGGLSAYVMFSLNGDTHNMLYASSQFLGEVAALAYFAFFIVVAVSICKAFGVNGAYTIGFAFLPTIFFLIFGFSNSFVYYGPDGNAAYQMSGMPTSSSYNTYPQPPYVYHEQPYMPSHTDRQTTNYAAPMDTSTIPTPTNNSMPSGNDELTSESISVVPPIPYAQSDDN